MKRGIEDWSVTEWSNTALDNYNLQNNYGLQSFDIKFVYNVAMYYSPKFFAHQKGIVGKALGGWTLSPLFTAQSGAPRAALEPTTRRG